MLYREYITDNRLYVFTEVDLVVTVWDDASDPTPGMPDHIYEYGLRSDFMDALSRVREHTNRTTAGVGHG